MGGGAGDGGRARSVRATGATVSISVFIQVEWKMWEDFEPLCERQEQKTELLP